MAAEPVPSQIVVDGELLDPRDGAVGVERRMHEPQQVAAHPTVDVGDEDDGAVVEETRERLAEHLPVDGERRGHPGGQRRDDGLVAMLGGPHRRGTSSRHGQRITHRWACGKTPAIPQTLRPSP